MSKGEILDVLRGALSEFPETSYPDDDSGRGVREHLEATDAALEGLWDVCCVIVRRCEEEGE